MLYRSFIYYISTIKAMRENEVSLKWRKPCLVDLVLARLNFWNDKSRLNKKSKFEPSMIVK